MAGRQFNHPITSMEPNGTLPIFESSLPYPEFPLLSQMYPVYIVFRLGLLSQDLFSCFFNDEMCISTCLLYLLHITLI